MSLPSGPAGLRTVQVALGTRSYDILIGPGALEALAGELAPRLKRPRAFVLTDETVQRLHGPRLDAAAGRAGVGLDWHALPPGEASKTFARLEGVLDWLLASGADRGDMLIAFGGGVTGDMGGLAACLMKRGMGFIQIPTTLLAQVDSSVGGKTAVNTARGKNLIGAFYQPQLVIADTALLETLPPRELLAGYAEIVKYGLINDRAFFDWLAGNGARVLAFEPESLSHAVARSCAAKAAIVAADETETGQRQLLNLGHTFAHAFEAANGYGPELLHGEAVSIGMVMAMRYSAALGLCPAGEAEQARAVLAASGLPVSLAGRDPQVFAPARLTELMRHDKKGRAGRVPLILTRSIGAAFVYPDADLGSVQAFLETELTRSD